MRRSWICLFLPVFLGVSITASMVSRPAVAESAMTLSKTDVGAPPEAIYPLIEDFRNWAKWSPHEKADPAVRRSYSGAGKGKGAVYEWEGGDKFGAGRAQIADASPPGRIVVDLDIAAPVKGRLALTFTFEPTGAVTKIAVATKGPAELVQYVMKAFFTDNLIRVSCAAESAPKPICKIMMKDLDG